MSDLKQRIFDLAKELQMINFATITENGKPWVRYVMGKADEELVFRFSTNLATRKIAQIRKDPNVHICVGTSDLETARNWMQVDGTAEISTEKAERHSFWFDEMKNYYTGPDDPNYCIVIVRPSRIEFATMGIPAPEVWE